MTPKIFIGSHRRASADLGSQIDCHRTNQRHGLLPTADRRYVSGPALLGAVFLDLRIKLLARDSKQCGSSNLIAVGALQRSRDQLAPGLRKGANW